MGKIILAELRLNQDFSLRICCIVRTLWREPLNCLTVGLRYLAKQFPLSNEVVNMDRFNVHFFVIPNCSILIAGANVA